MPPRQWFFFVFSETRACSLNVTFTHKIQIWIYITRHTSSGAILGATDRCPPHRYYSFSQSYYIGLTRLPDSQRERDREHAYRLFRRSLLNDAAVWVWNVLSECCQCWAVGRWRGERFGRYRCLTLRYSLMLSVWVDPPAEHRVVAGLIPSPNFYRKNDQTHSENGHRRFRVGLGLRVNPNP